MASRQGTDPTFTVYWRHAEKCYLERAETRLGYSFWLTLIEQNGLLDELCYLH